MYEPVSADAGGSQSARYCHAVETAGRSSGGSRVLFTAFFRQRAGVGKACIWGPDGNGRNAVYHISCQELKNVSEAFGAAAPVFLRNRRGNAVFDGQSTLLKGISNGCQRCVMCGRCAFSILQKILLRNKDETLPVSCHPGSGRTAHDCGGADRFRERTDRAYQREARLCGG